MTTVYETLPAAQRLQLALLTTTPAQLARIFASLAGAVYDRSAFDSLARQASEVYDAQSSDRAHSFRLLLDRRLSDRYLDPVTWDDPARNEEHSA